MVSTHTRMNISSDEYMEVMDVIFIVLDKNNIEENAKKEVLSILWSLKGVILTK